MVMNDNSMLEKYDGRKEGKEMRAIDKLPRLGSNEAEPNDVEK